MPLGFDSCSPPDRKRTRMTERERTTTMWTLSGFVDEISDDFDRAVRGRRRARPGATSRSAAPGAPTSSTSTPTSWPPCGRPLDRHGLQVSSIGSPIGKIGIDEDFGPHLERMRHAAEVAKPARGAVHPDLLVLHPRGRPTRTIIGTRCCSRMRALADVAEEAGVILRAREREGDLRRHPAPLPRHRHARSARPT